MSNIYNCRCGAVIPAACLCPEMDSAARKIKTKPVYRFFSYSSETGFDLHVTEEEAKAAAEEELEACADEAGGEGGWPDWTGSICWGEVKQSAKETNRRESEPEDGIGFWDYICDYEILDLGEGE